MTRAEWMDMCRDSSVLTDSWKSPCQYNVTVRGVVDDIPSLTLSDRGDTPAAAFIRNHPAFNFLGRLIVYHHHHRRTSF